MTIFDEIKAERAAQDAKWGGSQHDRDHTPNDWIAYITKHAGRASDGEQFRAQMVRVAALAVAAVQMFDLRRGERNPIVDRPLPDDDLTIKLGAGGTEDAAIGRFWGLYNVDSEGEPLVLFPSRDEAERYLKQRQAADPEGDDYLSQDWTILRVDAVLSVLNSLDPDPFPELYWPPRFAIRSAAELRTLTVTKPVAPAGGTRG